MRVAAWRRGGVPVHLVFIGRRTGLGGARGRSRGARARARDESETTARGECYRHSVQQFRTWTVLLRYTYTHRLSHAEPGPWDGHSRETGSTQASTFASMLLASFSPHSASVAVSSTPLYTKRSTALAPAACSLVFRSAAVSDGEIWIDTFDSVIFKLCVGVIHGVSGIGGYWGGVRLMSDRRDFLGRVCSWCFVAFFSTW